VACISPAGIGRRRLATDLARQKGPAGTVRNWRTVTQLLEIAHRLAAEPNGSPLR
jgi:uncharacterized protein (DUF1697 family)